jgi:hypothetical protein
VLHTTSTPHSPPGTHVPPPPPPTTTTSYTAATSYSHHGWPPHLQATAADRAARVAPLKPTSLRLLLLLLAPPPLLGGGHSAGGGVPDVLGVLVDGAVCAELAGA